MLFAGAAGVLAQDNANLFWDDTNNRLGIGTTSPAQKLDVNGTIRFGGGATLDAPGGDSFVLLTGSSSPNPNFVIGYGNAGVADGSREYLVVAGHAHSFINTTVSVNRNVDSIGTALGAFLVGPSSQFRVSNGGNITRINDVVTSFPASQGAASTFLQNNGSGILTWVSVPAPTLQSVYDADVDGGDATITTNATDGSLVIAGSEALKVTATGGISLESGTDTLKSTISGGIAQIRSAALPLLIQTNNGGAGGASASVTLKSGTSTTNFLTTGDMVLGSGNSTGAVGLSGNVSLSSGNSLNGISGALSLTTGNGGDYSGTITIATGTGGGFASPSGNVNISTGNSTNQPGGNITVIPGTGTANGKFLIGSTGQLQIDRTGNILKINNVATSFPASQGAASTVLTNNGSGVLTWSNSTVNVTTTASATVGQKIMTDSSGGAFTITLPASAILGDQIEIFDATDSWTANNITLARNGLNINGVAADFVLNVSGSYVRLIYYTAGQGWRTYP